MAEVLRRPVLQTASELLFNVPSWEKLPDIRSEIFGSIPITVFADDREALSVARNLAEIKTAQGDNHPFYLMDMGRVERLLNMWRTHLPNVQPFYSLRCNSDPVLLRLLVEQRDIGFYCSDRTEVEMAMQMVNQDRILYSNPFWTRSNLHHACDSNVKMLMFESERELTRIHAAFPDSCLILRVCMNPSINENAMRLGCEAYEEAPALLEMAANLGIKIVGISFSIGVGVPSVRIYNHAIALARGLFDVGNALGHDMCVLDIGGGFPGYTVSSGPSFAQVAEVVNLALKEHFSDESCANIRIIAEPGRYFAASVFSLITNIIDKRAVDASLVTSDAYDSGSDGFIYQTNEGFFGSFGCKLTAKCEPCCCPLSKENENLVDFTYATILGPTLDNTDVVQPIARLPQMEIGEWLLWNDMGAYSMGNREALGEEGTQPPTVYYFVGNEHWQQISRPSSPESRCDDEKICEVANDSEADSRSIDCQSVESVETDSMVTDDEPYWFCAQWSFD